MKLFVDDFRECPEGWVVARTVTEAIRILATQKVEEVSLDHDIRQCAGKRCANRNETFEPVAWYLASTMAEGTIPIIRIHTGNIQAGKKMAEIMGISYHPYVYNPKDYSSLGLRHESWCSFFETGFCSCGFSIRSKPNGE